MRLKLKICNIIPMMKVSKCENLGCVSARKCLQESLFKKDIENTKQINNFHKFIHKISKIPANPQK
jgi:hypothetical protein